MTFPLQVVKLYSVVYQAPNVVNAPKELICHCISEQQALSKMDENLDYFVEDEIFAIYNPVDGKYYGLEEIKNVL